MPSNLLNLHIIINLYFQVILK